MTTRAKRGLESMARGTASWVRRHDAVIVPGMGVLEVTVPMRPWQTPYSMFLLSVSGRLFRTKVAYVSVGTRHPTNETPQGRHPNTNSGSGADHARPTEALTGPTAS